MRCLFTERAERDLEAIANYIARENPRRAVGFVQELRRRCEKITDAPYGYQLVPEHGEDIRRVPYGKYWIFYVYSEGSVCILHIAHSAQQQIESVDTNDLSIKP